jgi:AraC-like DNA-binding protein
MVSTRLKITIDKRAQGVYLLQPYITGQPRQVGTHNGHARDHCVCKARGRARRRELLGVGGRRGSIPRSGVLLPAGDPFPARQRRSRKMDRRIERIMQMVQSDPGAGLFSKRLADSVNLSVSRTYHLFKREVGIPLGRFLMIARMHRAKRLLGCSFLRVRQVMSAAGYADETSFIRTFKKTFGVTPGRFRTGLAASVGRRAQKSRQTANLAYGHDEGRPAKVTR